MKTFSRGVFLGILFVVGYFLAESDWFCELIGRYTRNGTLFHMVKAFLLFTLGFLAEVITPKKSK